MDKEKEIEKLEQEIFETQRYYELLISKYRTLKCLNTIKRENENGNE